MKKILLAFALKYKGDVKKIIEAIKNREVVSKEELETIESKIKCKYITILDDDYPSFLKNIYLPPIVLFYYGDLSILNKNLKIGIIGARKNSKYGKIMCEKIISEMESDDPLIISGLAKGIDGIAHLKALELNLKTVAILAGGIDNIYPLENEQLYQKIKNEGLLISEYPNDELPTKESFLIRNRIIAAIADKILVCEASYKSGTMNTVAYGLQYGKDIYAVPYPGNVNSGCNKLIKQGATLTENSDDLLD